MLETWLNIVIGLVGALSGIGGGYILARRKYNAEVKTTEIENTNKVIEFWQESFKLITDQNRELVTYNSQLISTNMNLQKQISELTIKVNDLQNQVKDLENARTS